MSCRKESVILWIGGFCFALGLSLLILVAFFGIPFQDEPKSKFETIQELETHDRVGLDLNPINRPTGNKYSVRKSQNVLEKERGGGGNRRRRRPTLLEHLVQEFKVNPGNILKRVEILKKLEDLSHGYENGRNLFVETDVMHSVLLPCLDHEVVELRVGGSSLIGVAAQNNPTVLFKSVQGGLLPPLIQILKYDPVVRPRALYALGSLLRNYPDAQKEFILDHRGIHQVILIGYLKETKMKSLDFITDLMRERKYCRKEPPRPSYSEDESLMTFNSTDPCDKDNLLRRALEEGEYWKLLCQSIRYLIGDLSEEMSLIDAVHATIQIGHMGRLSHLRNEFQELLTKFRDSEFIETRKQLEEILTSFDIPHASDGVGGSILHHPPPFLFLIPIGICAFVL